MSLEWTPVPLWAGRRCYIIGGGSSLKGFDWELLRGEAVLGCCAAFYLGVDLVPVTVFGDAKFLNAHYDGLSRYANVGGEVFTNSSRLRKPPPPDWLHVMKKQLYGLHTDALGWNVNTGANCCCGVWLTQALGIQQDSKGASHQPSH